MYVPFTQYAFAFAFGLWAAAATLSFYWLSDRNELPDFEDSVMAKIINK